MSLVRHAGLLVLASALTACSLPTRIDGDAPGFSYRPSAAAQASTGPREAMHADLIRTMLAQRQYYAALAHIQQMAQDSGATPELRYLEAEVRRSLGQDPAAEALYRGLLRNAAYSGLAYQGLGLMAAARGDLRGAAEQLRTAAARRPTDAEIRNDLGYALMLAGRYREALPEIATAVELDPGSVRSRNNLLVLLMLKGDEAGVRRMAADSGIAADELARLRSQAQSLGKRRTVQEKQR